MRHYLDAKRIRRLAFFGGAAIALGLISMIAGIVLAFGSTEEVSGVALAASFSGLIVSQVGFHLRGRWAQHPRPDEILDEALKGSDERHAVFHYLLGASHALVSPAGVFAVCTTGLEGEITFRDGQWTHTPPPCRSGKPGSPRRLTEPARQTEAETVRLRKALARWLPERADLPVTPMLVFLHPNARLEAQQAPFHAAHVKKLKALLRSLPKAASLTPAEVQALARSLGLDT